MRALLDGGVALSACDPKGRTALHVALERLAHAAEEEEAEAEEEAAEAEEEAAEAEEEATAGVQAGQQAGQQVGQQAGQQAGRQAMLGSELQAMVEWLLDQEGLDVEP